MHLECLALRNRLFQNFFREPFKIGISPALKVCHVFLKVGLSGSEFLNLLGYHRAMRHRLRITPFVGNNCSRLRKLISFFLSICLCGVSTHCMMLGANCLGGTVCVFMNSIIFYIDGDVCYDQKTNC